MLLEQEPKTVSTDLTISSNLNKETITGVAIAFSTVIPTITASLAYRPNLAAIGCVVEFIGVGVVWHGIGRDKKNIRRSQSQQKS